MNEDYRVKFRREQEERLKAIRETGQLPGDGFVSNDDLAELYYVRAQKEGGTADAIAYALLRIVDVLHGDETDENPGIKGELYSIRTEIEGLKDVLKAFRGLD